MLAPFVGSNFKYLVDDSTGGQLVDDNSGAWLIADPQVYDLSGIAVLRDVFRSMAVDRVRGIFSGGFEVWTTPRELGWFKAILTTGGSLIPTTTANLRLAMETLRVTYDALAASAGTLAISISIAAQSPPFTLAAGKTPASGALDLGTRVIAPTNYNLSALTSLQATATQMVADSQTKLTNFVDPFMAVLEQATAEVTTMPVVRAALAEARAEFDLLGQ